MAQADKHGCCSSVVREVVINNPVVESDRISRGCCEAAGGKACSGKADTNGEIEIEATACCVAPFTKPASNADGLNTKVGCCSGVIEDVGNKPKKTDGCCSSVETPDLDFDVETDANLDGCCASKSKLKGTAVSAPHAQVIALPNEDKIDDCCSSKEQGIYNHQEIVPPCCEGIASNCCDGKHIHSEHKRE